VRGDIAERFPDALLEAIIRISSDRRFDPSLPVPVEPPCDDELSSIDVAVLDEKAVRRVLEAPEPLQVEVE
jgi:hypothetical protein